MRLEIIPSAPVTDAPLFDTPEGVQLLKMYAEFYPKVGYNLPWVGYVIIRDGVIIGTCGFAGAPNNNTVEIAYWTFEAYEGQGVASFACKELIRIARHEKADVLVTARTAPEDNASTRILEKHGFIKTGVTRDDEIGEAWGWQLDANH